MALALIKLILSLGLITLRFTSHWCVADTNPQPPNQDLYLLPLPSNYSSILRPNIGGPPVEVYVSAYISHLKFKHNEMEAVFFFRTSWTDLRLKLNNIPSEFLTFKGKDVADKIWTPDLLFPNAIGPEEVIHKGWVKLFTETGRLLRSQMLKQTFACSNLSVAAILAQPSQTVNCTIEVDNYGFTDDDIKIKTKSSEEALSVNEATMDQELFKVNSFTVEEVAQVLLSGTNTRVDFVINVGSQLSNVSRATLLHLLECRGRNTS